MYSLRMLGGISLKTDTGTEVDALLRQPKHVALVAYLASPQPGTWHKRDSILGTFWPENDQARSRSALRSALYTIRRHLPQNAIPARGDNDLSVDPELVSTDTGRMVELFHEGRYEEALACYGGEFLPGIYVPDAETFDHWLEQERRRTRNIASQSAKRLSEQRESTGDLAGAIAAARRNYELDHDDEGTARRLISLLDLSGDRAQAFAVYEEFRNHLSEAFGVRPSAETVALLDAVRTRHEAGHIPPVVRPTVAVKADKLLSLPARRPRHYWRTIAFVLIPVAMAVMAWAVWRAKGSATPGSPRQTVVVLPVENETGDASLNYLGTGIGEYLTRHLDGVGGLNIRSAAWSNLAEKVRSDLRGIARAYKADFLLRSSLRRSGDSLQLQTSLVDGVTLAERTIGTRAFSESTIRDVASKVAADIAGTVFGRALPPPSTDSVDRESDRLTMLGYQTLLFNTRNSQVPTPAEAARDLFMRAVHIDPRNARAWAGLSSIWAAATVADKIEFDEGFELASSAATRAIALDSLQGAAFANLGLLRALKYTRLSAGDSLIRKAEVVEPWNPEVYFIKSMLYRYGHEWDQARDAVRVARRLDPLNSLYIDREAIIDFCAGQPDQALVLYRSAPQPDPSSGIIQGGITRALAMLGRYDEALDSWRLDARQQSDSAMMARLNGIHGEQGYWAVRHELGRKRLAALEKTPGRVSPLKLMQTYFASGDSTRGFKEMDHVIELGTRASYRLSCMPDLDEFRNTSRMKAAVAKVGGITN